MCRIVEKGQKAIRISAPPLDQSDELVVGLAKCSGAPLCHRGRMFAPDIGRNLRPLTESRHRPRVPDAGGGYQRSRLWTARMTRTRNLRTARFLAPRLDGRVPAEQHSAGCKSPVTVRPRSLGTHADRPHGVSVGRCFEAKFEHCFP